MNAFIEKGMLSINLYDLLGEFKDEDRAAIIDALACRQEIIDEVMNQVIDGCTTEGGHGPRGWGGNPDAIYGIDGARMRIAKASSEIAAKEIEALGKEIERLKARINEGWNAYHELLSQRRFA